MIVRRASMLEGARAARGHAVIIDVYRAFTTGACAVAAGARELVFVSTAEEAFAIRAADASAFLSGEVEGIPIEGFDVGNSPSAVERLDLRGRRFVQRTSSGTQGIVAASRVTEHVLASSFVLAGATCRYLAGASEVTLVAMGEGGSRAADEDEACAEYLEATLAGRPAHAPPRPLMRPGWTEGGWPWWFPREDALIACDVDRFDFALPVVREGGVLVARPVRS